jgi:hypothetical protein
MRVWSVTKRVGSESGHGLDRALKNYHAGTTLVPRRGFGKDCEDGDDPRCRSADRSIGLALGHCLWRRSLTRPRGHLDLLTNAGYTHRAVPRYCSPSLQRIIIGLNGDWKDGYVKTKFNDARSVCSMYHTSSQQSYPDRAISSKRSSSLFPFVQISRYLDHVAVICIMLIFLQQRGGLPTMLLALAASATSRDCRISPEKANRPSSWV